MAINYATVPELRSHMDKKVTTDDATLLQILTAASLSIDRACNHKDGFVALPKATVKVFPGSGTNWQWIDECVSTSLVRVKTSATDVWTTWVAPVGATAGDYIACTGDDRYPEFNRTPYTALLIDPNGDYSIWYASGPYPTVEVTAKWGYALTVPDDIRMACIAQAARWYKRGQSAWSDALASSELGMLLYQQSLDPDIKRLLVDGRYVRPSVGRW